MTLNEFKENINEVFKDFFDYLGFNNVHSEKLSHIVYESTRFKSGKVTLVFNYNAPCVTVRVNEVSRNIVFKADTVAFADEVRECIADMLDNELKQENKDKVDDEGMPSVITNFINKYMKPFL